ncbi:DUF554 domain-containing protein [Miniphocaeibacter massiliensis]|uniref:DUF554 domain-containing protein n=1 Tax=Miniphocaeibacter massiliensis TaxID=2041841 RepID=UPI000C1BBD7A|nr:DUF554 domain-containing protein [Miniphocaeibacter massiliensis]
MFWIFANALGVVISGIIGIFLKKYISNRQSDSLMTILGLLIIIIGIQGALEVENMLLMIISLALGTFIGSGLKIHDRVDNLASSSSFKNLNSNFLKNSVTIVLIQCSGSLSILAALNYGLKGDATLIQFKTVLDIASGLIFASIYGASIFVSAAVLLVYQGGIFLLSGLLNQFLTPEVINEFSAVASVILIGVGLALMKIKNFKALDYLPAMFIPIIWHLIQMAYSYFI